MVLKEPYKIQQVFQAQAIGPCAAARFLCHFRHPLDVSSAYEIDESSQGRKPLGTRASAFLGSERRVGRHLSLIHI